MIFSVSEYIQIAGIYQKLKVTLRHIFTNQTFCNKKVLQNE